MHARATYDRDFLESIRLGMLEGEGGAILVLGLIKLAMAVEIGVVRH
jgi:hypothetical protein